MAIVPPGLPGAVDHINSTQGQFRNQIAEITSTVLRLGGAEADTAPTTTLYVNNETGSDRFVAGIADSTVAPPLTNQQITCGYSEAAPFRTIQRALIEAARLSVQVGANNDLYDRIVIKVAAGVHVVDNNTSSGLTVNSWGSDYEPTDEDLRAFNSDDMGIILPRGVSIIGADLRKAVIRPGAVPAANNDPITGRGSIFKTTGGSFFFNFTFKDSPSVSSSHHLLSAFSFCSESDLQEYYNKIAVAFDLPQSDIDIVNPGETQITTFYPDAVTPATDSTNGSSGYVFNCSLRSDYGMSGMFLDGSLVTGFKSMVVAQFTIVSLQRDMNAWEIYTNNSWQVPADYDAYINADSNNIRTRISGNFDPETGCYETDYRHFGFKLINNAFVQEVSCFVIGASVNHWTASGGECTITNSNSNFGMTALLSSGFRGIGTTGGAFLQDQNFECLRVRRPKKVPTDGTNIRQIGIGTVDSYDPATGIITLERPFNPETAFGQYGYNLKGGDFIWIENRYRDEGPGAPTEAIDVRAKLLDDPFDPANPTKVRVVVSNDDAVNNFDTIALEKLVTNRVYIRRLVDTRTPEEREYALLIASTAPTSRRPVGNYIIRLGNRSAVADQLDPTNDANEVFLLSKLADSETELGSSAYRAVIRPGDSASSFNAANYYRVGTPVTRNNRVFRSKRNQQFDTFSAEQWEPSLAMLPDARGIEFLRVSSGPIIRFDADLSGDPDSLDLGINQSTYGPVLQQVRSSTDFLGVALLMRALGYSSQDVGNDIAGTLEGTILEAQESDNRNWDPSDVTSPTPQGKLDARVNWPLEFNRPSLIRAFGHAYEFVGYGNYVKAMPKYQRKPLTDQNKVDYFAVNLLGGRVYNTGFNEDGLLVQGNVITDLGTQTTVNSEIAGLGALSGDPDFPATPTDFDSLTVNTLFQSSQRTELTGEVLINGTLEGSITYGDGVLPVADEQTQGIVELASEAEVAGISAAASANDTNAITPKGLASVRGQADGLCDLDASTKVPLARVPNITADLLPDATTTAEGIVELATDAETQALSDTARAVTPSNLNSVRGQANGFCDLDASTKVPLARVPDIPATLLPDASTTAEGVVELATDAETAALTDASRAITPSNLAAVRGQADGFCDLDSSTKIPVARIPDLSATPGLLPTSSTTTSGIVELATGAETLALTDSSRAVTPNGLSALQGVANGFASLDGSSLLPLSQVPTLPATKIDLAPVTWVPATDNFGNSANFNYQETVDGATINLGTPQLSGYEGTSGFIVVTRDAGVTTAFTGINDAAWTPIVNTWINPTTSEEGLSGTVLIGYYIASSTQVIYTATMVS